MASQNWQYNKTVISSLLGNDELNELGNEGWELVAMSPRLWVGGTTETTPLSATDTYVFYFKKPAENPHPYTQLHGATF